MINIIYNYIGYNNKDSSEKNELIIRMIIRQSLVRRAVSVIILISMIETLKNKNVLIDSVNNDTNNLYRNNNTVKNILSIISSYIIKYFDNINNTCIYFNCYININFNLGITIVFVLISMIYLFVIEIVVIIIIIILTIMIIFLIVIYSY